MGFDILLVILAGFAITIGTIGCVVPVLPGAPLAWAGLLAAYFCCFFDFSLTTLIIMGVASVAVSILDNIAPIYLTKKTGGTKAGSWGATIGLFIGLFIGPLGIILGPFLGALVGELIHDNNDKGRAIKSAFGAFLGFLAGTGIKLICCGFIIWIFVRSFF